MTYPTAYTVETAPAETIWAGRSDAEKYITVAVVCYATGTEVRDFDAVDNKGRRFGARVRTFIETRDAVTQSDPRYRNSLSKWTGVRYVAQPHAMRGGELYGAMPSDQYFETEAARDAYVAKYFADAEKRALTNKARAK